MWLAISLFFNLSMIDQLTELESQQTQYNYRSFLLLLNVNHHALWSCLFLSLSLNLLADNFVFFFI